MSIYLDNSATTRVCPEAAQAAVEAMTVAYGNPSSLYALGTQAAKAVAEPERVIPGLAIPLEPVAAVADTVLQMEQAESAR